MVKSYGEAAAKQANFENRKQRVEREQERIDRELRLHDPNELDASDIYDDQTGDDLV